MLAKDISHLLSTYSKVLTNAASISMFHYIYLKSAALEIAYFRVVSSSAALVFILFTARNKQEFIKYYLFVLAYAVTQLTYQILAISAVIEILTKTSGRNAFDTSFWLDATMMPSTVRLLSGFLLVIAPSAIFIGLCIIIKARIEKTLNIDHAHIFN